jgi:predicted RecA/RadA family phage recombinase
MAEATLYKDASTITVAAPAAGVSGQVIQLPDGRAGYVLGLKAYAAGDLIEVQVDGQATLTKSASVVVLDGDQIFWDRSANSATPLQAAADADFAIGVAVGDAASAATTLVVALNVKPVYTIDVMSQSSDTVIVLTAGTPHVTSRGGQVVLGFSATNEVQKVDLISKHAVPVAVPFIVEGKFAIVTEADDAAADINIGLANATHASDADSITESVFLHFDGNATAATMRKIYAESDDGTTEVAATDTTVVAGANTDVEFRMDCRDLTDIQIYINGVLVLPASVFKLDKATGPMKLLAHMEKTANDTPGVISITKLAIRTTDVL